MFHQGMSIIFLAVLCLTGNVLLIYTFQAFGEKKIELQRGDAVTVLHRHPTSPGSVIVRDEKGNEGSIPEIYLSAGHLATIEGLLCVFLRR